MQIVLDFLEPLLLLKRDVDFLEQIDSFFFWSYHSNFNFVKFCFYINLINLELFVVVHWKVLYFIGSFYFNHLKSCFIVSFFEFFFLIINFTYYYLTYVIYINLVSSLVYLFERLKLSIFIDLFLINHVNLYFHLSFF